MASGQRAASASVLSALSRGHDAYPDNSAGRSASGAVRFPLRRLAITQKPRRKQTAPKPPKLPLKEATIRSGSLRQTYHCRDRCYLREAPGRHRNGCCGQYGETRTPHHRKAKLGVIMAHFASRPTELPLPRNSSLPHLIVQSPARRPVTSQRIEMIGAGEGNRTLVISLEGCCSTIELHPRRRTAIRSPVIRSLRPSDDRPLLLDSWDGGGGRTSNLRRRKPADLQSAPFATRDTPPPSNVASSGTHVPV